MYPSVGGVERIGGDWDWIWIDAQHGELDYHDVLSLVRACDLVNRPAIVRVASHEDGGIGKALDTGAAGVIVPIVDTPEQALQLVQAAKFPPLGGRSYGGRRPIDRKGRGYSDTANTDILLIAQIETPEAVLNAEKIASIDGIDALFLGPDDLLLRRGLPMDAPRNRKTLGADLEKVVHACHSHGKIAITVGVSEEMLKLCAELGFDMIVAGSDVGFLATGSKDASSKARAHLELVPSKVAANGPLVATSPY